VSGGVATGEDIREEALDEAMESFNQGQFSLLELCIVESISEQCLSM